MTKKTDLPLKTNKMISIKEVQTIKELKQFIRYPKQLYKDCLCYVSHLKQDEYQILTTHPARSFCSARQWLAYMPSPRNNWKVTIITAFGKDMEVK